MQASVSRHVKVGYEDVAVPAVPCAIGKRYSTKRHSITQSNSFLTQACNDYILVGAENASSQQSPYAAEAMHNAGVARVVYSEKEEQVVPQIEDDAGNDADAKGVPASTTFSMTLPNIRAVVIRLWSSVLLARDGLLRDAPRVDDGAVGRDTHQAS
jgi:hypothetical protein